MLTLKLQNLGRLFSKENYTGKKVIDPEADELILEEALKRKNHTQIKISVISTETFTDSEKEHFLDRFKEYYIHKSEELIKIGKRQDKKFLKAFRKGFIILATIVVTAVILSRLQNDFITILGELSLVGGWVAMWKPFEYFIYQRNDHKQLIKACEHLTRIDMEIMHEEHMGSGV